VARDVALARETGARLHICHVSTAGTVDLIRAAKADGISVTAEVTPHHLSLTDDLIAHEFDPMLKVNPPLCTRQDVEAVRQGLADGTIDCIATDHAPHAEQEKDGEFDLAPFGMIGLETALSVCREALIDSGKMDWADLIARLTSIPARVFGLGAGTLAKGRPADITLIDPEARWRVSPETLVSKSKNTPFMGRELKSRVCATLVDGRVVHRLNGKA
jgi:dihydroorotase